MKTLPTYTAQEIKEMAKTITDYEAQRTLALLINEEIDLYDITDMQIVTAASLILFNRSLLMRFLKP